MTPRNVYIHFRESCPDFTRNTVIAWFPNGKNSIRLRLTTGQQFIYSITKEGHHMRTLAEYLTELQNNRLKGEKS